MGGSPGCGEASTRLTWLSQWMLVEVGDDDATSHVNRAMGPCCYYG